MKALLWLLLLGLAAGSLELRAAEKPCRILFLGDSITYAGRYVELVEAALIAQHPAAHYEVLNLGLPSETVSGSSEAGHAGGSFPRPDLAERVDRVLAATQPDLVFACYGMNCGIYHPLDPERFAAYRRGIESLRAKVLARGARMIHLTPPVFDALPVAANLLPAGLDAYPKTFAGYDDVLGAYGEWLMAQRVKGWAVLDLHTAMRRAITEQRKTQPNFTFSGDGVHPDEAGHRIFARLVTDYLGLADTAPDAAILEKVARKQRLLKDSWLTTTGHKRPGMSKGKPLAEAESAAAELDASARELATKALGDSPAPFPGTKTDWNGSARYDFPVAGHTVTVVVPAHPAPGRPWCWEGEFFGHKPAPDIALLARGFHIVYVNAQNLLGSPEAVADWNAAYDFLTHTAGLNDKPALTGLSRGGLYAFNWAVANPSRVACIYADAAVCDFKSWPGGKGKGKGDAGEWGRVPKIYGLPDEAAALAYPGNPVDNLAVLAKAGVPLLHVYGDADDVVPWDENTGVVAKRYRELGGNITLIAKPGVNHHPHGLEDSTPIVEFIRKYATPKT